MKKVLGLGPIFSPGPRWLLLACLAGLVLGLVNLSNPGLWCDEIYTARWTQLSLAGLMQALRTDLHPPLYFILENLAVGAFGESEAGLRVLSVLAGLAVIAVSYWAMRPLFNERLSAAAAWFLALSPQFFLYSRMARYYSLAALVAMLAHGLFVRLMVRRGKPRSWLLYGLSVALLLYTSYIAVCVVLAHGVWSVFARRRRGLWQPWLAATAGGVLLFTPWLGALIAQSRTAYGLLPSVIAGPGGLALMLGFDLHALTASELVFPWTPLGFVGLVCGGFLLFAGSLAAVRRGLGRSVLLPALSALGFAWVVLGLLAHATPFVGLPARTLFIWPFAAALLALGALDPAQHKSARVVATLGLLACWAVGWLHLYGARDWMNPIYLTPGREVAAYVAERADAGTLVLSEDDTGANYYLDRLGFGGTVIDPMNAGATAAALTRDSLTTVWWVRLSRDGSRRNRPDAATAALLDAWGRRQEAHPFLRVDPVYRVIKRRVLGLPGYEYRVSVEVYRRADLAAPGAAPPAVSTTPR